MLEINQYINVENLPDGAILPSTYPTIQLDLKAGTHYYYNKLQENLDSDNPDPTLQKMMNGDDMHPTWGEFDDLNDITKSLVQQQTEHIIKEAVQNNKRQGFIPGELSELIDGLFTKAPPVFNWKAYLRRVVSNSMEFYVKKTRRKESNRFKGAAGLRSKPKHNILFAIDTSDSMNKQDLDECFNELHHIYKTGASITIMEADTRITRVYEYKGKCKSDITGRGGTDFTEVVEHYNAHKSKYGILIYFSDGYGSTRVKPHKNMLWVISSNGKIESDLPGHKIKIER